MSDHDSPSSQWLVRIALLVSIVIAFMVGVLILYHKPPANTNTLLPKSSPVEKTPPMTDASTGMEKKEAVLEEQNHVIALAKTPVSEPTLQAPLLIDAPNLSQALADALARKDESRIKQLLIDAAKRGNSAVPELLDALHSGNAELSQLAGTALAGIGTPDAVKELLDHIRSLQDPEARSAFTSVLKNIRNPEAVPTLTQALRDNPDNRLRLTLQVALGNSVTPEMLPSLLDHFFDEDVPDPYRRSIAQALASSSQTNVMTALRNWLGEQQDPRYASYISSALSYVGTFTSVNTLFDMAEQSGGGDLTPFRDAFRQLHNPDAVPALSGRLQSAPSPDLFNLAVEGLAGVGNGDAAYSLLKYMVHTPDADRVQSIQDALGRMENPETIPILLAALHSDQTPREQGQVLLQVLAHFSDSQIIKTLGDVQAQPLLQVIHSFRPPNFSP